MLISMPYAKYRISDAATWGKGSVGWVRSSTVAEDPHSVRCFLGGGAGRSASLSSSLLSFDERLRF